MPLSFLRTSCLLFAAGLLFASMAFDDGSKLDETWSTNGLKTPIVFTRSYDRLDLYGNRQAPHMPQRSKAAFVPADIIAACLPRLLWMSPCRKR